MWPTLNHSIPSNGWLVLAIGAEANSWRRTSIYMKHITKRVCGNATNLRIVPRLKLDRWLLTMLGIWQRNDYLLPICHLDGPPSCATFGISMPCRIHVVYLASSLASRSTLAIQLRCFISIIRFCNCSNQATPSLSIVDYDHRYHQRIPWLRLVYRLYRDCHLCTKPVDSTTRCLSHPT